MPRTLDFDNDMESSLQLAKNRFIDLWGEMATNWGISKTMAQIYALLFASSTPLDTEQIMQELKISRGNANINVRKLLTWKLVVKCATNDTRRDFFVAEKEIGKLVQNIVVERQKREISPISDTISAIGESLNHDACGNRRDLTEEEKNFQLHLQQIDEFITLCNTALQLLLPALIHNRADRMAEFVNLLKYTCHVPSKH